MRRFYLIYLAWFELQAVLWFKIGNVEAIVGGEVAVIDQFKYMVSVQKDGKHVCGGAIVSKVHVITAAHCVIGEDNHFINKKYTILARVTNLMSNVVPPIEGTVKAIFACKDYVYTSGKNQEPREEIGTNFYPEVGDIAVLQLEAELPMRNYLRALKLPTRGDKHNLPKYTNLSATLTGFGSEINLHRGVKRDRNSDATTSNQNIRLKFIKTTVQHKNECRKKVPYFTHDKYIIAMVDKRRYEDYTGACIGDDGSPLVHDGFLIGVLAQYWPDCNEYLFGSAYTRVSFYLQYIKEVMKGIRGKNSRFAMYVESTSTSGQTLRNLVESV